MDFLRETRWPPPLHNRRYHERKTTVAMGTIDQLSTYIYVYVDDYQNNIYHKELMILSLSRFFANLRQEFQFAVGDYTGIV